MSATPSDHFVVETPENIRFGYDIADIGSRFLAVLIDSAIQGVLYIVLFLAMIIVGSSLTTVELPEFVNVILVVGLILTVFLIQFGYFLFLEIVMGGQTPGKRMFRLRVVKDNGYPLSTVESIIRNLIRIIDFFPIGYGIGIMVMFLNRRAKRLGDFAAGTLVVKLRDEVRLSDLQVADRVPEAEAPLFANGVERLEEPDIALVESFLARRGNFTNADALARQIAGRLGSKMGREKIPEGNAATLAFLRETVNEYRRRRG